MAVPSTMRAVDNQHEMRRIVGDPLPNATARAALFDVDKSDASFRSDMHTKRSYTKRQARDGSDVMGRLTIWGDTLRSANVSMAVVTSRFDDGARVLSSAMRHNRVIIPETSSNVMLLRDKTQLKQKRNHEERHLPRQPLNKDQPLSQRQLPLGPRAVRIRELDVETSGRQYIRLRSKCHKRRYKNSEGQRVIEVQHGQGVIRCLLHCFITRGEGYKNERMSVLVL